MAQELKSINLVAPAFKGVNTEDSPLAQDPSFAEIADNAVIDKRGRIASRKGHTVLTTNKTVLGNDSLRAIKNYRDDAGNTKLFSVGNNKIISGTTTLVDETPSGYAINANDWKIVNFNDHLFFFQRGYEPLVYAHHTGNVEAMSSHTHASGVASTMYGNEVLAAYGRLWTADFSTNKSTIYWSDLLDGVAWAGGSSGSIDISKVWPDGYDEIVALAAHNDLLIIFGKHSIVVYEGATSPDSMALVDTVAGIGCVNRDTVQYTGTDVLFLAHTGLKSFGRTIQEKSMPISSLSGNITKDIIRSLQDVNNTFFRSVYSPEESFYLLTFVNQDVTYCFDVRGTLENGSYKITRWVSTGFSSYSRKENGDLLIGTSEGVSKYEGYEDNNKSYRFKYYSPSLTFGDSSRVKILKKLKPTLVGANNATVFLKWAYDFNGSYSTAEFTVGNQITGFYGESEYTTVEFTGGVLTAQKSLNATGYGTSIVVGLEADINGNQLSLQEINVMALIGKLL